MTKYRIYLQTIASFTIDVEAEDEHEALDLAFDQAPSICAQCSGWGEDYSLELGEYDVIDGEWFEKIE